MPISIDYETDPSHRPPTGADIAWMAGLFDGEGCITNKGQHGVVLKIAMTDLDLLERFQVLAKCGSIQEEPPPTRPHHKQCYRWRIGDKENVTRLLILMRPWFGDRRTESTINALERLQKNIGLEFSRARPGEQVGKFKRTTML